MLTILLPLFQISDPKGMPTTGEVRSDSTALSSNKKCQVTLLAFYFIISFILSPHENLLKYFCLFIYAYSLRTVICIKNRLDSKQQTLTLPAVIAYTQLLTSQITVPMVWTATIGFTVWDITGFSFPILVTLTVYPAWNGQTGCTLSMFWTVIRTRINSGRKRKSKIREMTS